MGDIYRWLLLSIFLFISLGEHPSVFGSEAGWSIFDTSNGEWERITENGSLEISEQSAVFQVPANHESQWKIVTEPVWIYRFQELRVTYRAEHIKSHDKALLTFDAGIIPALPAFDEPIQKWDTGNRFNVNASRFIADGNIHELVIPVYERLQKNQVDEIWVQLQSTDQEANLEILEFVFTDPSHQSNTVTIQYDEDTGKSRPKDLHYHSIPVLQAKGTQYHPVHAAGSGEIQVDGVPFSLPENRIVPSTPFAKRGVLTVPVNRACAELYLLLNANIAGSDYSFRFVERKTVREPERLLVEKVYEDGSVERSFPYHIKRDAYEVHSGFSAYAVPANPQKVMNKVRIYEWMSYGNVFLAGVTSSSRSVFPLDEQSLPWIQSRPEWVADSITPSVTVEENKTFRFENKHYRMELQADDGLRLTHLSHQKTKKNLITTPSPLFAFMSGTFPVSNKAIRVLEYEAKEKQIAFTLSGGNEFPLLITLTLRINQTDTVLMNLRFQHTGSTPVSVKARFPLIENIQIGEDTEDDYYFFPRKRTAWGNRPVRLSGSYSGAFPLQWMDVYSQSRHYGVAIHTIDPRLNLKRYLLMKDDSSTRMAVEYGDFQALQLQPGEEFLCATAAIQIHDGDWHEALKRYQKQTVPIETERKHEDSNLDDVFLVYRDYPVGGTGMVFDLNRNAYTFSKLMDAAVESFGGVDLIDLSGWQYSKERGRVGAYEDWDIGTPGDLRRNIAQAQEQGTKTGLYLSGYLLDERSGIEPETLRDWHIKEEDNTPKTRGEHELYMNPFHPEWQKYLSETAMRVLDFSGAQAVYLDQIGFADNAKADYSGRFAFPFAHPLLGEHMLLAETRDIFGWLERPAAMYAEQVPVDLTAPLLDGACSLGMTGEREYPSPTRLNAFRFAYPSFKIFEKIQTGVYPNAADSNLVKLSFFHGHGFWLKGKPKSWFSKECRDVIRAVHGIFHKHKDVFTSNHFEPMIPTLQYGLFANRFESTNKTLITIYNATSHTIDGTLLACSSKTGHAVDEWGVDGFSFQHEGEQIVISGVIHPHGIGCFAIE